MISSMIIIHTQRKPVTVGTKLHRLIYNVLIDSFPIYFAIGFFCKISGDDILNTKGLATLTDDQKVG